MANYPNLRQYLQQSNQQIVRMTFNDIENNILGHPLPPTALSRIQWWKRGHSHASNWLDVGYEAYPDFSKSEVEFRKKTASISIGSQVTSSPSPQPASVTKSVSSTPVRSIPGNLKEELQEIAFAMHDIMLKLQGIIDKL